MMLNPERALFDPSLNLSPWRGETLERGTPSPLRGGQGGVHTGKELDEETDYSYFGARYYDPNISIWLSVDPLSDHLSQVDKSPYSYAWNNPVFYTDPDGRCPECEENAKNPEDGQTYESSGGAIYTYTNGDWTRNDGEISGVEIVSSSTTGDNSTQGSELGPFAEVDPQFMKGAQQQDFSGIWGSLKYFWTGGNINGVHYDNDGNTIGPSPTTGTPPVPSYGKGIKLLQKGGHILKPSTLKALKLTKGQGKTAIESIKKANGLRADHHGRIMSNGDYLDDAGRIIDNILDYVP
jgi:RHS repeat-associated protein